MNNKPIPKEEQFGWKKRKVRKPLLILDGYYECEQLVFDPTVQDMERRLKFILKHFYD